MNEMGVSASDILTVAKEMETNDTLEVLFKVSQLIYELRALRNSAKETTVEEAKNVYHGSKR